MRNDPGLEAKYPTLWLFFGGYMYQCWRDEFPDEWALADAFVRDEPLSANHFLVEANALLSDYHDESQLRDILLDGFGAAAMVENRGWKYRDWLQAMATYVAKSTGHPRAS
jgi:hypothetical protein